MSLSRFLSTTSLVTGLVALAGAPGCGDDSCGTGGAPTVGLVASGTGVTMTFGNLRGSFNNDCPDPSAPTGVISLSIEGTQTDGQGRITLCISRPDVLAKQSQPIGSDRAGQVVRLVDLAGSAGSCTFTLFSVDAMATATARGLCDNGGNTAGWALEIEAAVTLSRTCGTTMDMLPTTLMGRVAVAPPPNA
jgi:hypothetical protein